MIAVLQRHEPEVDEAAESGRKGAVIGSAANVNEATRANALPDDEEREAFGDAGYRGSDKRPDATGKARWNVAMRPGKRRVLDTRQKSTTLSMKRENGSCRSNRRHTDSFNESAVLPLAFRRTRSTAAPVVQTFPTKDLQNTDS